MHGAGWNENTADLTETRTRLWLLFCSAASSPSLYECVCDICHGGVRNVTTAIGHRRGACWVHVDWLNSAWPWRKTHGRIKRVTHLNHWRLFLVKTSVLFCACFYGGGVKSSGTVAHEDQTLHTVHVTNRQKGFYFYAVCSHDTSAEENFFHAETQWPSLHLSLCLSGVWRETICRSSPGERSPASTTSKCCKFSDPLVLLSFIDVPAALTLIQL